MLGAFFFLAATVIMHPLSLPKYFGKYALKLGALLLYLKKGPWLAKLESKVRVHVYSVVLIIIPFRMWDGRLSFKRTLATPVKMLNYSKLFVLSVVLLRWPLLPVLLLVMSFQPPFASYAVVVLRDTAYKFMRIQNYHFLVVVVAAAAAFWPFFIGRATK